MAIKYGQAAVTSSAAKVLDMSTFGIQDPNLTGIVNLTNSGSNTIYLGGDSSVTSSNGYPLLAGGQAPIGMFADDAVWAVSPSGSMLGFLLARVK